MHTNIYKNIKKRIIEIKILCYQVVIKLQKENLFLVNENVSSEYKKYIKSCNV
jgi:hypothetical protein